MGLSEQMERDYAGRTKGRIAPSKKIYLNYLHQLDIKRLDAILKEEAKAIGFRGSITCDVCQPILQTMSLMMRIKMRIKCMELLGQKLQ